MQTSDAGRYGGSTSNAYSPNLRRPGGQSKKRTALKVALCLLLPPVGLLWIWRTRSFALRGRILTSALACASLCLMCLPLFQPAGAPTVLPQPVAPVAATRAPEEDTTTRPLWSMAMSSMVFLSSKFSTMFRTLAVKFTRLSP